ncbi:MAG: Ig-like domain-containing protein, partial [bacterium]
MTITVTAVNDAPVAEDDAYSVNEDGSLPTGTSVLANDTDEENDTLTAVQV